MDYKKLKGIEKNVFELLLNDSKTRGDDFVLYAKYIEKYRPDLRDMSFIHLFNFHKKYELPSYESVTRARRKLQAKYLAIRPTETARKNRKTQEETFIQYARSH